jgi:type IV secretion system protein VirB1
MDASTLLALALACAPQVHPDTVRAIVSVESSAHPWAIGVVGGALERQPRHRAEAAATAAALQAAGWNFSLGLGQINVHNLARLGISADAALDPCTNLAALQKVLTECYLRAAWPNNLPAATQLALRRALSCYYSGNFTTGFQHGYVRKVVVAARALQSTSWEE